MNAPEGSRQENTSRDVELSERNEYFTRLEPQFNKVFGPEKENTGKHVGEVARDTRIASAVAEALASQRPVAGEGMSSVLPLAVDGSERAFRFADSSDARQWLPFARRRHTA